MDNIFNELVAIGEIAKALNKNETTIRKRIKNGDIKEGIDCKKFGCTWIIKKAAIEKIYGKLNI